MPFSLESLFSDPQFVMRIASMLGGGGGPMMGPQAASGGGLTATTLPGVGPFPPQAASGGGFGAGPSGIGFNPQAIAEAEGRPQPPGGIRSPMPMIRFGGNGGPQGPGGGPLGPVSRARSGPGAVTRPTRKAPGQKGKQGKARAVGGRTRSYDSQNNK